MARKNTAIQAADGVSGSVVLYPQDGVSTVQITCDDWNGATGALEGSVNGEAWSPVRESGSPIQATSNWIGVVDGNGYLRLNVDAYGGTPVKLFVSQV